VKSVSRDTLVRFLDEFLDLGAFADYGPQGLQVEGRVDVSKVVVGVSASAEFIRRAIAAGADLLLCHHGILWDGKAKVVRGGVRERLRLLLGNDLTLLGYHLALDAHPTHGNNACIARALKLTDISPFGAYKGNFLGCRGSFPRALSHEALDPLLRQVIGAAPLTFPFGPDPLRTIGIISGGAEREVEAAVAAGLDAYLTGEVSEFVQEYAREEGITFISAGHYRTETFGVRALADLLQQEFGIVAEFIDVPNPV
jgi:dinuclear metal center YbgI/SA1388 family protein